MIMKLAGTFILQITIIILSIILDLVYIASNILNPIYLDV